METLNVNDLEDEDVHSLSAIVSRSIIARFERTKQRKLFDLSNVEWSSKVDDPFDLKNFLCVPIMDSDGHVIGVSQVMNKLNGKTFTEDDVVIIEVICLSCS